MEYTKKLFLVYLKFTFHWVSCVFSGKPSLDIYDVFAFLSHFTLSITRIANLRKCFIYFSFLCFKCQTLSHTEQNHVDSWEIMSYFFSGHQSFYDCCFNFLNISGLTIFIFFFLRWLFPPSSVLVSVRLKKNYVRENVQLTYRKMTNYQSEYFLKKTSYL